MSISIADLIVTQEGVRDFSKILSMVDTLIEGGSLAPIKLSQIQGSVFVHDGHHRVCAYWFHGVKQLQDTQYNLRSFMLSDYEYTNIRAGWLTPFNPFKQVRLTDINPQVKKTVERRIYACSADPSNPIKFHYKDLERLYYTKPRTLKTVKELCLKVLQEK